MPTHPARLFAVIPAAGFSRRMGQPKLLLPLGGKTVIARLLEALALPENVATAVVMRRDDAALREEVARYGGWPVSPDVDPPDMRTSVEFGLQSVSERFSPHATDAWLMLPADHPVLDRAVLSELIAVWRRDRPRFLVPTYHGRRGHPLIARWDAVPLIQALPADQGLNRLLRDHADEVVSVPVENPGVLTDLDSPEDYERLRGMFPDGDIPTKSC
ncbi:MAG: nucleotidyltransferase family protein [Planctomycetaceae bacterium]|nr:nucleotidyltransferase family protein [Planctomycetaceae bacterium]